MISTCRGRPLCDDTELSRICCREQDVVVIVFMSRATAALGCERCSSEMNDDADARCLVVSYQVDVHDRLRTSIASMIA